MHEIREWKRTPDRGPIYMVRCDGTRERLTRRHEPISGALLWPVMCLLMLGTFVAGVQVGKREPVQEPVPVAERRAW